MKARAVIVLGAMAVVTLGLPAPAGATAAVATVPASIPSDCSRDVSAELVAWIASVPDGSTLQFTPQGCYRVDRTLTIRNRHQLTFEGNGATFRAFTSGRELPPSEARTRSMFSFWQGSNITVRNTIVRGANPNAGVGDNAYVAALEAQTAYVVGGVQNMVLDHVEAYDVYGDFVFVGAATNNLLVKNSTFARNGRQGWTINGQDIVFEHNNIRMTRRATIDLEPSSVTSIARRVTIRNNTIGVGRLYFLANVGLAAPTEDISVIGNTFVNKTMTIRVNPPSGTRSRFRVIGNTSNKPMDGSAMVFNNVLGVEVRDNIQPMQRGNGSSGVSIKNCRDVTVTGNWFPFGASPIFSRGGNFNVSQSNNYVGHPLRLVAPSQTPGPA
ncbi:MAG: right-handed parallel beta-helix repeat-containing protein [Acidimicrobiia bacterium]